MTSDGPGAMSSSLLGSGDRVRLETRVLSAFIVPFLIAAFVILYLMPTETGRLFAWPIAPAMTSFLLASAYLGGAYFFARVVFLQRWHRAGIGFMPVVTFASMMMVATIVHWDRFSHGNLAFWAWASIYATTPFLVLAAWLRNRGMDPQTPEEFDARLPTGARIALGAMGLAVLVVGLGLFVLPTVVGAWWPWHLTSLTARVVGACFALTGVFGLSIVRDARWSSARIPLQSQAIGMALILGGTARAWATFNLASATSWLFVIGLLLTLVAISGLYIVMERRVPHRGGVVL